LEEIPKFIAITSRIRTKRKKKIIKLDIYLENKKIAQHGSPIKYYGKKYKIFIYI